MFRIAHHLLGILARYAAWSSRRPLGPLAAWLTLAGLTLALAAGLLSLDARFDALLPSDTPAVKAREEARWRMGSTSLYLIAITSPDALANVRFAKTVAAKLKTWPEVDWVLHRRDLGVLRRYALLYADEKDLGEAALVLKRVVDRAVHRARAKASGFMEIDDEAAAAEKAKDKVHRERLKVLAKKYRSQRKGERTGKLFKKHPDLRDAMLSDDGTVAVAIARLHGGTNNLEYARRVYNKGEKLIASLHPKSFHPKLRARVMGAYGSFKGYDQAISDVRMASYASLGMVLLLLVIFFRRLRAILVVLLPLLVGVAWTAGFAGLVFGEMNIITSFIAAILIGLGIDYGIHYYAAYHHARRGGEDLESGLTAAVQEAGPGMFTAAFTTMAALLTLVAANFRAFQEFGMIAAAGVFLCLLSALLVMPPLVALLDRLRPETFRPLTATDPAAGAHVTRRWRLAAIAGGGLALLISAGLLWRAPDIGFEYDFNQLKGKKKKKKRKKGIGYDKAMRGSRGSAPMALMADSVKHMQQAHRWLAARQAEEKKCCDTYLAGGEPRGPMCHRMGFDNPRTRRMVYTVRGKRFCRLRVRDLVTVGNFIPTGQAAKLGHIRSIRATLRPDKKRGDPIQDAPKDVRAELEDMRRHAQVDRPLRVADLPEWIRRSLTEKYPGPDGEPQVGAVGFLYTGLGFRDVRDMQRMADEYGLIKVGARPVRVAATQFIVAAVVTTVKSDGRRLFLFAFLAVLALLLVDLFSITGAVICFLALSLGMAWSLGAMQLLDLKLGVYNMLVVPTALGVGIDGSVHLYHRFRRLGADYAASPLGHTGLAVVASSVTTAAGFAGLFFIQHGGLRTIAQFATLSICFTLGAILLVLPGLLIWRAGRMRPDAR